MYRLIGLLLDFLGTGVGQVLTALGLSLATFTGLDLTLGWLRDQSVGAMVGLPAELLGILALMKVGKCISIVFSAYAVRQLMQSGVAGSVKRLVRR